jgi:hypothetical protein
MRCIILLFVCYYYYYYYDHVVVYLLDYFKTEPVSFVVITSWTEAHSDVSRFVIGINGCRVCTQPLEQAA